jgi:hypothetical protein
MLAERSRTMTTAASLLLIIHVAASLVVTTADAIFRKRIKNVIAIV